MKIMNTVYIPPMTCSAMLLVFLRGDIDKHYELG
jgi:hypothetical protein